MSLQSNKIFPINTPDLLREVIAAPGHGSTAVGFGLALAAQTMPSSSQEGMLLWVREAAALAETGAAYAPGLAAFGLSPDRIIIVEARTQNDTLRAALEGARCSALSAIVLETLNPIDLTASRRLKLAAEKSGVAIVIVRLSSRVVPNAAQARWRVQAAPGMEKPDGSRRVAFETTVMKHPAGPDGTSCIVEWDHDRRCFTQTIPLPLDAVSDVGPLAA